MDNFEPEVAIISLVPSDGGKFEVEMDGKLVFSKLQTKRHAEKGEIVGILQEIVEG